MKFDKTFPHKVVLDFHTSPLSWCVKEVMGQFQVHTIGRETTWYFADEKKAIMFKMLWSDHGG